MQRHDKKKETGHVFASKHLGVLFAILIIFTVGLPITNFIFPSIIFQSLQLKSKPFLISLINIPSSNIIPPFLPSPHLLPFPGSPPFISPQNILQSRVAYLNNIINSVDQNMDQQVRKSFEQGKPPTLIFTLMILTNILINLDHGILPACTSQMQEDFGMDQFELGLLGSIVYLGISLMGLFAGRLYQHFNSKILTVIALILLEISLSLFVLSTHKVTAYLSRFATGVCQVFLLVYYPIWIDKYGKDKKTMWLTLLQICVPVGIFMGYGMTAVIIATGNRYQLSFYIQIGVVAAFILAFLFLSKSKLDSRRRPSQDLTEPFNDLKRDSIITDSPANPPPVNENPQSTARNYDLSYMFCHLMKSKMYLVGTFSMAVILYVSTGIQFWLTKYFIDVLGFDQSNVFIAYAVVSVTGPTTGAGFGGYMISKIGGYDNPKTVYYVFVFSCIGIGSAVIIPFVEGMVVICILLWIVLFFGGAMMPGLTGIMMSSVSPYLRAFGNSTGQIIKNIFGYLPSPFVYGMFNTYLGNRAGIKFLMFWGLWAPILCGYGSWHKYHHLKRLREKAEKDKTILNEQEVYSDLEDSEQGDKQIPITSENEKIDAKAAKDQPQAKEVPPNESA